MPSLLAHLLVIYALSNVFYLLFTRNIGTPFADSLTEQQKQIKADSGRQRRQVFLVSLVVSSFLVYWFRPFQK